MSVVFAMSMMINYFYENFSSKGKSLNDTLFLSLSSLDSNKKPLEKQLLPPTKKCQATSKDSKNKFSIEGC